MSKRLFGIISDKTGIPSALIVNSLNRSQSAQIAEARDENGKVIKQQAYSIQKSVNLNGITTVSDPIDAGKQITIAGETYLIDQAAQNESNTAFVDVSLSAIHSDQSVITQIGDTPVTPPTETIDLSFITADPSHILSGFVGADQNGNPITGTIQTVTPSIDGNKFSIEKGYVAAPTELTVPEAQIIATDEKVTIGVGYLKESKEYELASSVPDIDLSFVTAETNQILSGFTGADKDGNPVHGSIETVYPELSDSGDIKIHIDSGYLEDSFDFNVKEGTIEVEQNRVILRGGYYSPNMLTVGELYLDTEITPGTEDQTIPANSFIPQDLIIKGVNTSNAFGIVKVTEYSPYIPAYPDQIGYVVDINATDYNNETGQYDKPYDLSAYEGLYTVTEETKHCSGFGLIFKNANGKFLYAWTYETWDTATDEASSAHWCISDNVNYGPEYGPISASSSANAGTLPNAATGWYSPMGPYQIDSCTLTPTVTAPATAAIPMVLKGSVTSGYNTETKVWTDGTASSDYTGFEVEPYKDWYYASVNGKLIGGDLGSSVAPVIYLKLDNASSTAETGQTVVYYHGRDTVSAPASEFKTVDGVPCFYSGNEYYIELPTDEAAHGNEPFSVMFFARPEQLGDARYVFGCGPHVTANGAYKNRHFDVGFNYDRTIKVTGQYDVNNEFCSPEQISWDKWVHIAVVRFGTYELLYINGKFVGSLFWERDILLEKMRLGATSNLWGYSGFSHFPGYIAEFKYYAAVVSPAQIKNEADRCLAMVQ